MHTANEGSSGEWGLYVGGGFTGVDSAPAFGVAKLGAAGWETMSSGLVSSTRFYDLETLNGHLYGAGVDHTGQAFVKMWTGSTWLDLGAFSGAGAYTLAAGRVASDMPALYVGGDFTQVGTLSAYRVAKWTGFEWRNVGQPSPGRGFVA